MKGGQTWLTFNSRWIVYLRLYAHSTKHHMKWNRPFSSSPTFPRPRSTVQYLLQLHLYMYTKRDTHTELHFIEFCFLYSPYPWCNCWKIKVGVQEKWDARCSGYMGNKEGKECYPFSILILDSLGCEASFLYQASSVIVRAYLLQCLCFSLLSAHPPQLLLLLCPLDIHYFKLIYKRLKTKKVERVSRF